MATPKFTCIYCGQPSKRGKRGEHIVPKAIGGAKTLLDVEEGSPRVVCTTCNGGPLSHIDEELCCRSHLSVVASQMIDGHMQQVWDVDHSTNNILVEARPEWKVGENLDYLYTYPQITFEPRGPGVRAFADEAKEFGWGEFIRVMFKAARHSFARYKSGEKRAIIFEPIQMRSIYNNCRYPPRVFFRKTIFEVARDLRDQTLILRYVDNEDRKYALHHLSVLSDNPTINTMAYTRGSFVPQISFFYDLRRTVRALMKIGFNLLAAHCTNTQVNCETFPEVTRVIRGITHNHELVVATNGFVRAEDVQSIKGADNDHAFRLVHDGEMWRVYFSFFGCRVGAYAYFPGPNKEKWMTADVVAPIGSKEWTIKTHKLFVPLPVKVLWNGLREITPSFKLREAEATIWTDYERLKPERHAPPVPTP